MEDRTQLFLFSSSGVALGEVPSYLAVRRMVEQHHDRVFDASDPAAKAWVEIAKMRYEFDDTVQPQDIRKAWNRYMGYPTTDR